MDQQNLCSFTPQSASGAAGFFQPPLRLSVTSTTGSPVELTVPPGETAEGLRTSVAQKLRLQADRIVLLHRDRLLTSGRLLEQGVTDGSKLTLVPVIEAGLICSTAREKTIMDMLESLTEVQIDDFLSGRSPLTLSIGAGAHTMNVELQLSAGDVKQQVKDLKAQSSCKNKTDLHATGRLNHPDSASSWSSTGSDTSQTSSSALRLTDSTSSIRCSAQRPRTSFKSAVSVPNASCHNPLCLDHSHPSHASPLALNFQRFSGPPQATTPAGSAGLTGSRLEPLSPAPASKFSESNINAKLSKPPGAVIESLVSPSPGVFSGTFSGTLAPCSQSGISHRRRGIAIILQILNDLLRAAYYNQEGAPAYPPLQRCHPSNLTASHLTAEVPCKARCRPPQTQRTEHRGNGSQPLHICKEENKTLHGKLERLHFLMHQRYLRRRTRRSSHFPQNICFHQRRHHQS